MHYLTTVCFIWKLVWGYSGCNLHIGRAKATHNQHMPLSAYFDSDNMLGVVFVIMVTYIIAGAFIRIQN